MTLSDLQFTFPDATEETWHQHFNGGGWVQNTATVDDTAFVGPGACVYGNARVSGNAWVHGNAKVSGYARVSGNASVSVDNVPTICYTFYMDIKDILLTIATCAATIILVQLYSVAF